MKNMKKLLYLMLLLLLPVSAFAASPVLLESSQSLLIPGTPEGILECIALPDGGALMNVSTFANLEGTGEGEWRLLYLMRVDASGAPVWETRYHAGAGPDIIDLALTQDSVIVHMYNDVIGNANCKQTTLAFDLETGRQTEDPETLGIPTGEIASVFHDGDFRVDQYFHNDDADTVRTLIHYLPTGRLAEYEFHGLQHCAAFGDKLVCCFVDASGMAYYSVYGTDCLPLVESALIAPGAYVNHIAADADKLFLFAWTNRENPDRRTYTVYPLDSTLNLGAAIASFTLAEGHALGQTARCGEGFLLTDESPWEYGPPTQYDLLHLAPDGTLTPIATMHQELCVYLLPGADGRHTRVICQDGASPSYLHQIYTAQ